MNAGTRRTGDSTRAAWSVDWSSRVPDGAQYIANSVLDRKDRQQAGSRHPSRNRVATESQQNLARPGLPFRLEGGSTWFKVKLRAAVESDVKAAMGLV